MIGEDVTTAYPDFLAPEVAGFDEAQMLEQLLYRDACMLIMNKPAGIAVHKGAHKGLDYESFFHFLQFGLPRTPKLAHRLDRETSGCLVLGRHTKALARLGKRFTQNRVEKTYLALVVGRPAQDTGIIDMPILKTGEGARWRIILDPAGQESITHYQLLDYQNGVSLLRLSPKTGRTHQLRVHLAGLGTPIIGDPFYGEKPEEYAAGNATTMLHAHQIEIPYYPNKPAISVTAPLPEHMLACMRAHGLNLK